MRVFPQLKGVSSRFKWGGRIAITDDHLPHLHEPQPGLLVELGYNGRGVAMSNVMGRVMAERVLGADTNALAFPIISIKPVPLHPVKVAGMSTEIWFMRLMSTRQLIIGIMLGYIQWTKPHKPTQKGLNVRRRFPALYGEHFNIPAQWAVWKVR